MIPFFKLLERNCDSVPTGKLPGAGPQNRSVWSSVEINVGFKNKYASCFCLNISKLMMMATVRQAMPTTTMTMVTTTRMAMATTMATATVRWAAAQRDMMTITMVTGDGQRDKTTMARTMVADDDDKDIDGNGEMGNEVDDDGNNATGDNNNDGDSNGTMGSSMTGYNNNDNGNRQQ